MMSRTVKIIAAFFMAACLFSFRSVAAEPQAPQFPQGQNMNNGWRDRMRAEKIAFFTAEIGLTSADAEKFWPVYFQIESEMQKYHQKVGESFFALQKAIDSKASESEVQTKLQAYTKALEQRNSFESSQMSRYSKVLSVEKIARLYVAEENFRRNQIHRLHVPGQQPGQVPGRTNGQAQR